MIGSNNKSTRKFISYFHGVLANFRYEDGPAREVIECGVQLARGFLPGASGRTRRFFTQLLFHNPHSFSLMEAINSIAFF